MAPARPPKKGVGVKRKAVPEDYDRSGDITRRSDMILAANPSAVSPIAPVPTPVAPLSSATALTATPPARHKAKPTVKKEVTPLKRRKVTTMAEDGSKKRDYKARRTTGGQSGFEDKDSQGKNKDDIENMSARNDEFGNEHEHSESHGPDHDNTRARPNLPRNSQQSARKQKQIGQQFLNPQNAPSIDKVLHDSSTLFRHMDAGTQLALTKPPDVKPSRSSAAELSLLLKITECKKIEALITKGEALARKARERLLEAEGLNKLSVSIILANWIAFTEIAKSTNDAATYNDSSEGTLLVHHVRSFFKAYEAISEVKKRIASISDLSDLEEMIVKLLKFISEQISKQLKIKKRTTSQKLSLYVDEASRDGVLYLSELVKEQKVVVAGVMADEEEAVKKNNEEESFAD